MNLVFVYGTFKRGYPNHGLGLAGQRFVAVGRTVDTYPLVTAGKWYSPVMIDERGQGRRVRGELYELDDAGLQRLDALEGSAVAIGYGRRLVDVEVEARGEVRAAWTYVKPRSEIDVIHGAPMEEYVIDARYVPGSDRVNPSGEIQ